MANILKLASLLKAWWKMNKELSLSYDILKKVYFDNAYANIMLNKSKSDDVNFGLVTKIVYGVIEKDIYLEYVISQHVKNYPKPSIMLLLKLGTYVLKNINSIPEYAVVNELVNLSKIGNDKFVAGFVNSTLKNIAQNEVILPSKTANIYKYYSIKYSYPEWIITKLLEIFDENELDEFFSAVLTDLTHVRIVKDREEFIKLLKDNNIECMDSPLDDCVYVDYAKLLSHNELSSHYTVQGLPSVICAKALGVISYSRVLDCTGAPGGKSGVIGGIDKSINVICSDLYPHRVLLIKQYMKKLGLNNVEAVKQNAVEYRSDWSEKFDYVLCDVPCSGVGVINKKPDIVLNRNPQDIVSLASTQYKILSNNSKYVKPGGILQYSTCSILKEENQDVINRFLKENPQFELTPIRTYGVNVKNQNNMYTFYPHISGTEGFFIARMKRK